MLDLEKENLFFSIDREFDNSFAFEKKNNLFTTNNTNFEGKSDKKNFIFYIYQNKNKFNTKQNIRK